MKIGRRQFAVTGISALACVLFPLRSAAAGGNEMYGLIGKMVAAKGKRAKLVEILLEGTLEMPGCLSYVVANDTADADAIWITEVWESREKHMASLKLPDVQKAIEKAKPLIAGFGERFETEPVGGYGLSK